MAEVITRYVLRNPLILADEISGYAMVFIAIVGLAYAMREGSHIRITFVVSNLPVKFSNWLRVFTLFLFLVYSSLAASTSYEFLALTISRGVRSNSWLLTPLVWPRMALPIGFILLGIFLLMELIKAIEDARAGRQNEKH
jgi:TRAP-type C4-dicarboxylate transport system permease small subunit